MEHITYAALVSMSINLQIYFTYELLILTDTYNIWLSVSTVILVENMVCYKWINRVKSHIMSIFFNQKNESATVNFRSPLEPAMDPKKFF